MGYGFLGTGTRVSENLVSEIRADSPFLGTQKSEVACHKMKDKLYPDTSVSENAQKRFFRRVPDSLENGTRRSGNPDTPG